MASEIDLAVESILTESHESFRTCEASSSDDHLDTNFASCSVAADNDGDDESDSLRVVDGLLEEAIFGACIEFHRGYIFGFYLDPSDAEADEKELAIHSSPYTDIFGQSLNSGSKLANRTECTCPECDRTIAACRFAPHLEKCMGMGRSSSRLATRRIANRSNRPIKSSGVGDRSVSAAAQVSDWAAVAQGLSEEDSEPEVDNDVDWVESASSKSNSRSKTNNKRKKVVAGGASKSKHEKSVGAKKVSVKSSSPVKQPAEKTVRQITAGGGRKTELIDSSIYDTEADSPPSVELVPGYGAEPLDMDDLPLQKHCALREVVESTNTVTAGYQQPALRSPNSAYSVSGTFPTPVTPGRTMAKKSFCPRNAVICPQFPSTVVRPSVEDVPRPLLERFSPSQLSTSAGVSAQNPTSLNNETTDSALEFLD